MTESGGVAGNGQSKASIPFLITRRMRAQLGQLGLSESWIDKLSPQQAHDMLAQHGISLGGVA